MLGMICCFLCNSGVKDTTAVLRRVIITVYNRSPFFAFVPDNARDWSWLTAKLGGIKVSSITMTFIGRKCVVVPSPEYLRDGDWIEVSS